jgi:hypothetical protein
MALSSLSLSENATMGLPLSANQQHFYYLVKAIQSAHGDITNFVLKHGIPWVDWMRLRTAVFMRRILQAEQLPGLPRYFYAEMPPPASFACYAPGTDIRYLSVVSLYRHFFLDKALTYYVELYSNDIRDNNTGMTAIERAFLKEFSYLDFVACITYLGSLLLQAAQGFSRILYEGLRLMLIKAYCSLGILQWESKELQAKLGLRQLKTVSLLSSELCVADRLPLVSNAGMSYAQYGWELLLQRPGSVHYLAALTQTALFKAFKAPYIDCLPVLDSGYVFYSAYTKILDFCGNQAQTTDVLRFCNSPEATKLIFYACPCTGTGYGNTTHEWYLFADLLCIFISDDYVRCRAAQRKKIEALSKLGLYTVPTIETSIEFPIPSMVGISKLPGEPLRYRLDLAQYLRQRFNISLNYSMYQDIPLAIYNALKTQDERGFKFNMVESNLPSLSTTEVRTYLDNIDNDISVMRLSNTEYENSPEYQVLTAKKESYKNLWTSIIYNLNYIFAREVIKYLKLDIFKDRIDPRGFLIDETNNVIEKIEDLKTPLQPWEFSIDHIYLRKFLTELRQLKGGIKYLYQLEQGQFPSTRAKKTRKESQTILPPLYVPPKEPTAPHTPSNVKPGRRPTPIFFSIPSKPTGFTTMMVTYRTDTFYVGFSGAVDKSLRCVSMASIPIAKEIHTYSAYPYIFLPLDVLLGNPDCLNVLKSLLNYTFFMEIADQLKSFFPSSAVFFAWTKKSDPPSWIFGHNGATNIESYLKAFSTLWIDADVLSILKTAHCIRDVGPVESKFEDSYFQELARNIQQDNRRTKDMLARMSKENGIGDRYYAPNFTPEEDLHIKAYISPYMTDQDKNLLMAACPGRPWPALRTRARNLTQQLLTQDKVFDVDKLPINNYTAKIRKQLEANFEAALNVDPRLKVNEDKNTVEALKKRYLALEPRRR